MRVALVGRPAARARLRAELAEPAIEIAGEFDTVEDARAALDDAALLVAPADAVSRHRADQGAAEGYGERLTARERDVLGLLAAGLPNRMIAERLGISDQTVKFHVASILGKLGASNRTDAVRRAVRRGLISI
jgi:two-component system, NarL family, nitrate/nitrite response regulator NarL